MMTGYRMYLCGWIKHSSYKSNGYFSLASFLNDLYLHLNCRSINISRPIKQPAKVSAWHHFFRTFFWKIYEIVKASDAGYNFSKPQCFQHVLLNTLRRMCLKHKNFDEYKLKIHALIPIWVKKNKN